MLNLNYIFEFSSTATFRNVTFKGLWSKEVTREYRLSISFFSSCVFCIWYFHQNLGIAGYFKRPWTFLLLQISIDLTGKLQCICHFDLMLLSMTSHISVKKISKRNDKFISIFQYHFLSPSFLRYNTRSKIWWKNTIILSLVMVWLHFAKGMFLFPSERYKAVRLSQYQWTINFITNQRNHRVTYVKP